MDALFVNPGQMATTSEKYEILDGSNEEVRSGRNKRWSSSLSLLCLLAVLPAVLFCLFLTVFLHSTKRENVSTSAAETLAEIQVPIASVSGMGSPPSAPPVSPPIPPAPAAVTPAKPPRHLWPFQRSHRDLCSTQVCRFVSQSLRSKLDETKDPCTDFYSYVCGEHKGISTQASVEASINLNARQYLEMPVPRTNQLSWQKAAGLYHACHNFNWANESEAHYLAKWMQSLNLDFINETRLATVDPVDMIVRCALDLGVPAILTFDLDPKTFYRGKRVMTIRYAAAERIWLYQRAVFSYSQNRNYYAEILRMYGLPQQRDVQLASQIVEYEEAFSSIINNSQSGFPFNVSIGDIYLHTNPYISKERWVNAFSNYTNNIYTATDYVVVRQPALNILVNTLKNPVVGEKGLRYLVAWTVYKQLVNYTLPYILIGRKCPKATCFVHTSRAMHLAIVSPYLKRAIQLPMVEEVKTMVTKIRDAFRQVFRSSSWIMGNDKRIILRKLSKMTPHVGSPSGQHEQEYIEKLYEALPDIDIDHLFPSWIKAVAFTAHILWTDQSTFLYDETAVNAWYAPVQNSLIVSTAIIQRPYYSHDAPPSLNYGALGSVIGHEMMHGYDVAGVQYDDNGVWRPWTSEQFTREYTKRALCVRRSHRAALRQKAREETLDHASDSENLADIVGAQTAYGAFAALPRSQRARTLVGINASAERLFFISYCAKFCASYNDLSTSYAPYRSRCTVPLMNMPEFSDAFSCAAGQPMNPADKCNFWA